MYKDSFKYKGQILNGNIRDGYGTLKREPIDDDALCFKYEGPFQNDLMGEGPGELIIHHCGETPLLHFKGGFKHSLFNQYGSLVTPDYTYEGHFVEGRKCGSGKIKHPFYCYEGIWLDDDMQGPGTLAQDLTVFTGQMVKNKKDSGILKLANGDEYHGKFDQES